MVSIKTVAVIGGSGNLGHFIVQELVSAGFDVTGLTRASSTNSTPKYPDGLNIVNVDYSSFDSLKSAFAGQDAVVSVIGSLGIASQTVAVDAAVAAGVKRFIPSEFGINTRKVARDSPIAKIIGGKIAVVDYLQEKASANPSFTWTGISTGIFFDWALRAGALLSGINLKDKTATVVDSGNEKWQASLRSDIGKAVVGVLKHPDETANKYIGTATFNVSINDLISLVEELTGSKLAVTKESSDDIQKAGEEKLAQGDFSAFINFLRVHNSKDGAGNALSNEDSANGIIGLQSGDLREVVTAWLKESGAL
ncbi:hypothetical protein B0T22DRAFT_408622 [Podospora appendiculata]|uniref:NmrA-like domain-containing protein n=1 Tax=Podospora appendiculata TaxID=314037 RepID=A0AAE1CDF5_9PEZI|nr:hypothetical protein B0T22DRAFT_408622 [Podospora appendiculata]